MGKRLDPSERAFFEALADIVFANPFGDADQRLRQLTGRDPSPRTEGQAEYYADLVGMAEAHLDRLAGRGIRSLDSIDARDAHLLRYGFLFTIYHRYLESFDRLIQQQIANGGKLVVASFAAELSGELDGFGFPVDERDQLIGLCFQLRRAYYFIDAALVGSSEAMRGLRRQIWNSIFTVDIRTYALQLWERMEDFTTLLLGETGTGKGSAAMAIGRSGAIPFDEKTGAFSASFTDTFVACNLSQFPESLIESELFGHRKGAFTGAIDNYEGLFERCNRHGVLFLDEIGDVSIPVQIKLLNVLQERFFSPVGSHVRKRFHGRIIAATNRNLDDLLGAAGFRTDFYYRLSSNVIRVPPLRERVQGNQDELVELTRVLLARMVNDPHADLVERIMLALEALPPDYAWPGNVRELEQAIRRILMTGYYEPTEVSTKSIDDPWLLDVAAGSLSATELAAGYCERLYAKLGTYEGVARSTGLDRRTVKKYVDAARSRDGTQTGSDGGSPEV